MESGCSVLSPSPHYDNLSANIGGSALGDLPFSRHPFDSEPDQGDYVDSMPTETWPTSPTTRQTIVVEHYGDITDSNPHGSLCVRVYRQYIFCDPPCGDTFEEITSQCTVLLHPNDKKRVLWICLTPIEGVAQDFAEFYNYKVEPRVSGGVTDLRSDGTGLGTAPNVYQYSHYFSVWPMSRPGP